MTVTHSVRIDEELDRRVRSEAKRRHKNNVSDMLRDLIAHGFEGLPPLDSAVDLSPLPDAVIAKALKQMSREELAEAATLGRACSRPKTDLA